MNEPLLSRSSPEKPSAFKSVVITTIVIILVLLSLWLWRESRPAPAQWAGGGAVDVVTTTLKRQQVPVTLQAFGEVRAVRQVMLPAEVGGRVAQINFEAGRAVTAGSLLVQLDDAIEQADLAAAQADAVFAQQQLQRASKLVSSGAISSEIFQQREAEYSQRHALVKQLNARIRQKQIRAPFAGELGLRRIDLGQYLNPGDGIVTLTDLDTLYINFDIPQQALAQIKIGQQVTLNPDMTDAEAITATISAIEPQVAQDTRNARIQATVANTKRQLHPGMFVSLIVALPPEPDTLLAPATIVMTSPSGDTALVVRELSAEHIGQAEFVPISVGRRIGENVTVTRGLQAGDVVVTEGQLRVRPGSSLRIINNIADVAPTAVPAEKSL